MLFIPLFVALCVKLDPGTHKGMYSVLAQKLGVTKVIIKAVLTVGHKPRVDWTFLRTYSLQNYFSKALVSFLSLFHWFYLNCYLILCYFQILDGSYSPHSPEEHWKSTHWTASAKECAASVGATT
jgi:hypothetical protein